MRKVLLLVVACLLAACGRADNPALTPPSGAAPGPSSTAAAPPPPSAGPAQVDLVLGPRGLGPVSFGGSKTETLDVVESILGPADGSGPACELRGPDSTTVDFSELSLIFDGEVFADYSVSVPEGGSKVLDLRTNHGIGLGSTVAELRAAYAADRLEIPGLPEEFGGMDFAIGFGDDDVLLGGLSDTADDGTITSFFTSVCE